ncbi:MAG: NYN domain-containing protein [Anaerolineae bacterium]
MPLLIDGHNLIGQMKGLSLADPADETKLLARLQSYYARTKDPITVVFDPGDLPGVGRPAARPGITVIYAPHGEEADDILIRRIERETNKKTLTVVSSDRRVVNVAQLNGVQTMRAQEFASKLAEIGRPASKTSAPEDKPAASSGDVDYWMGIFKEPPPKPPKPTKKKWRR